MLYKGLKFTSLVKIWAFLLYFSRIIVYFEKKILFFPDSTRAFSFFVKKLERSLKKSEEYVSNHYDIPERMVVDQAVHSFETISHT